MLRGEPEGRGVGFACTYCAKPLLFSAAELKREREKGKTQCPNCGRMIFLRAPTKLPIEESRQCRT